MSSTITAVIVISILILAIGGYFLFKTEEESLISSTSLVSCLSSVQGESFPQSLDNYQKTPVSSIEDPNLFFWMDLETGKFKTVVSNGYYGDYESGEKYILSGVIKLKKTRDYNDFYQNMNSIAARGETSEGIVIQDKVRDSITFISKPLDDSGQSWFILPGDNYILQFSSIGTSTEESRNLLNNFLDSIC